MLEDTVIITVLMTNGVERGMSNIIPEELAMFNTDLKSKGLSLAGAICQKWGNICLDNIVDQKRFKYVNSVGEHFKKILEDVANDWLYPSNGIVEGPVSDLSLETDVIAEVCEGLRGRNDRYHHDKSLHCIELDTFNHTFEDRSITTLATLSGDMSQEKETYSPTLFEYTSFDGSGGRGECNKYVSKAVSSLECTTRSHSSVDRAPPTQFHQNEVSEGDSMLSNYTSPMEIDAVTEGSDSFDMETMLSIHDAVDKSTEPIEEFEDIMTEDFGDGAENYEYTLIPHRVPKGTSYKRKFKNVFNLKSPSSDWCGVNNKAHKPGIVSSPLSCDISCPKTVTSYSYDCDWELL